MILDGTVGRGEMSRCVLCDDAPCSHACPRGVDPARILRGVWLCATDHTDVNCEYSWYDGTDATKRY